MADSKPILELDDITAGYVADIDVLRGVTLRVLPGSITSIIGANGAGKSTVLRATFGFARVSSGHIRFQGNDITNSMPHELLHRGISYVAQGRCNFPEMTVRENLYVACYSQGYGRRRKETDRILHQFPMLAERSNEMAGNLSGGQQQILEMAMGLVVQPKLLLIDEPTLGLSPKFFDEVFSYLQSIRDRGVSVLMVEQNAARALAISDWAIVLDLGRKYIEGTGEDILDNNTVRERYLGGVSDLHTAT